MSDAAVIDFDYRKIRFARVRALVRISAFLAPFQPNVVQAHPEEVRPGVPELHTCVSPLRVGRLPGVLRLVPLVACGGWRTVALRMGGRRLRGLIFLRRRRVISRRRLVVARDLSLLWCLCWCLCRCLCWCGCSEVDCHGDSLIRLLIARPPASEIRWWEFGQDTPG